MKKRGPSPPIPNRPKFRPSASEPPASSDEFSATELEVRSLVRRAQLGLPMAMDALTNRFYRMLYLMAIKAARRGQEQEDFVSIAYLFFVDCVRTFDFRRGVKFITHCYARIPLQLLKPRTEYDQIIRVPVNRFYESGELFAQPVSMSTDSEHDNFLRCNRGGRTVGVEHDFDAFERNADIERVRAAVAKLPEPDRGVVQARMAGLTFATICKPMGVTKERVRQIELRAMESLRRILIGENVENRLQQQARRSAAGTAVRKKLLKSRRSA